MGMQTDILSGPQQGTWQAVWSYPWEQGGDKWEQYTRIQLGELITKWMSMLKETRPQ